MGNYTLRAFVLLTALLAILCSLGAEGKRLRRRRTAPVDTPAGRTLQAFHLPHGGSTFRFTIGKTPDDVKVTRTAPPDPTCDPTCETGQTCKSGKCVDSTAAPPKGCGARFCFNHVCTWANCGACDTCEHDVCVSKCGACQTCDDHGSCVDEVCSTDECLRPASPGSSACCESKCDEGKECVNGECQPPPCEGDHDCPNPDCQKCQDDGSCTTDPEKFTSTCVCDSPSDACSVACEQCKVTAVDPDGTITSTTCSTDDCECTIDTDCGRCQTCSADLTCVDEVCSADECLQSAPANPLECCESKCDEGDECVNGECQPPPCEGDHDCPNPDCQKCQDDGSCTTDQDKFTSTCACEDDPCDPACEECQVTELNADGSIKTTACINVAPCSPGPDPDCAKSFDVFCYKCGDNPLSCLVVGDPDDDQLASIGNQLSATCVSSSANGGGQLKTCGDQQCGSNQGNNPTGVQIILNIAPSGPNEDDEQCIFVAGDDDACPCIPNGLSNFGKYTVCVEAATSGMLPMIQCEKLCGDTEACPADFCPGDDAGLCRANCPDPGTCNTL